MFSLRKRTNSRTELNARTGLHLEYLLQKVKDCNKIRILDRVACQREQDTDSDTDTDEDQGYDPGRDVQNSDAEEESEPEETDSEGDHDPDGDHDPEGGGSDDPDGGGSDPEDDPEPSDSDLSDAVSVSSVEIDVAADEDIQRNEHVLRSLKNWAMWGVSASKVDELLRGLSPIFPLLPRTQRTLLKTPRVTVIHEMGQGKFWYKGVHTSICQRLTEAYCKKHNAVVIDVGMDGVLLFKAGHDVFWPILGCLKDGDDEPFIIAVYHGEGKPPFDEFLEWYVQEIGQLTTDGLMYNGAVYPFSVQNYILDAEGRQHAKYIINHNHRHGCEKCEAIGVRYRHRTVFLDLNAELRTDESFSDRRDPQHHIGEDEDISPLEEVNTGMISQFRLDPMHLVDIGAFKRWMQFILGRHGRNPGVISGAQKSQISDLIDEVAPHAPIEFNGKARNLKYFAKYKAKDFRKLLRYFGLKVFKSLDDDLNQNGNLYHNFLLLFCGIYILSDDLLLRDMGAMAEFCLRQFIAHSARLFGAYFVVYCIHNLSHLFQECQQHGNLNRFTAYKFENYLGIIKRYLRSTYIPLQQLYNRDHEREGRLIRNKKNIEDGEVILSQMHNDFEEDGIQYSCLETHNFLLNSKKQADSCFRTNDGEVATLVNILETPDGIILVGHKFSVLSNYFDFPFNSMDIGICRASRMENRSRRWRLEDVTKKCVIIPDDNNTFLCIPLLHV